MTLAEKLREEAQNYHNQRELVKQTVAKTIYDFVVEGATELARAGASYYVCTPCVMLDKLGELAEHGGNQSVIREERQDVLSMVRTMLENEGLIVEKLSGRGNRASECFKVHWHPVEIV